MPDCVKSFQFLDANYCQEISNKVLELKDYWTHWGGYFNYPFYTLGAASYLDAPNGNSRYYEKLITTNPIIKANFADLFARTKAFLESKLKRQCIYDETQALPGFHVFLDSDFFEIAVASKHVDLQYKLLNWQNQKFDPANNISFTVYTAMPSNGGGLYFWDFTYDDLNGLMDQERNEKLADVDPEFIQFNPGDLVIHTGLNYHQIAPMTDVQPGDQRISLQGHGVLIDDVYHLYW